LKYKIGSSGRLGPPDIAVPPPQKATHMLKTQDYLILGAAFISFLFSVALWFGVIGPANKEAGIFVGIWVPSILATGIYLQLRFLERAKRS
jgi:hypothetical protein